MSAFLSWLMSSEPCTPPQAVAVCAVVFGVMIAELVAVALWCGRGRACGRGGNIG